MDLSIIIVNYNTKDLTLDCIASIANFKPKIKYEIILIDNASSDGSQALFKKQKIKTIYNSQNVGFAKANNQGVKNAQGRYILLLNSDTLIKDSVLTEMVTWMDKNPEIGVASCALENKDGSIQGTGGYFPTLLRVFSWMTIQDVPFVDNFIKPFQPNKKKSFSKGDNFYNHQKELDWLTGAFLLIKRKVLEDVGGFVFDEDYFMYGEDLDFCFRAKKAGWKVIFNPKWSITHFGGSSSTREFPILSEFKSMKIFYKKHYPAWQYPFLRLFLKLGALGRILLFAILEGRETANIYAKAFIQA